MSMRYYSLKIHRFNSYKRRSKYIEYRTLVYYNLLSWASLRVKLQTAASHNIGEMTSGSSKGDMSNQQEITSTDAAAPTIDQNVPFGVDEPINQTTATEPPPPTADLTQPEQTETLTRPAVVELTSQEIRDIRKPKGKKTLKKKKLLIDEKQHDKEVQQLYKSSDKKLFTREDKYGWMSKTNDYEFHGLINSTVTVLFERPLINMHEEILKSLFK